MKIGNFLKGNVTTILTVVAVVGTPVSSYLTGKAVLKAEKILRDIPEDQLKTFETRKKLFKVYLPAIVSNLITIGSSVACYVKNKRIQAGYLGAYTMAATTLEATRSKMTVEEEMRIENEIVEERVNAEIEKLMSKMPGEEYELWVDDYRNKPFWARKSDILLGKDEINRDLASPNFSRHFGTADLTTFYSHVVGDPEPQDQLRGWDIDYLIDLWENDHVEVDWTTNYIYTDPETGRKIPCNYIYWINPPFMNYWNYDEMKNSLSENDFERWVRENS